jgi:hypothetical protein
MGEVALQRLEPDGAVSRVLGETRPDGQRRLRITRGLAIDRRGDVYVAGMGSHNVLRLRPDPPVRPPPAPAARP